MQRWGTSKVYLFFSGELHYMYNTGYNKKFTEWMTAPSQIFATPVSWIGLHDMFMM
jgi:hypothetical protein